MKDNMQIENMLNGENEPWVSVIHFDRNRQIYYFKVFPQVLRVLYLGKGKEILIYHEEECPLEDLKAKIIELYQFYLDPSRNPDEFIETKLSLRRSIDENFECVEHGSIIEVDNQHYIIEDIVEAVDVFYRVSVDGHPFIFTVDSTGRNVQAPQGEHMFNQQLLNEIAKGIEDQMDAFVAECDEALKDIKQQEG